MAEVEVPATASQEAAHWGAVLARLKAKTEELEREESALASKRGSLALLAESGAKGEAAKLVALKERLAALALERRDLEAAWQTANERLERAEAAVAEERRAAERGAIDTLLTVREKLAEQVGPILAELEAVLVAFRVAGRMLAPPLHRSGFDVFLLRVGGNDDADMLLRAVWNDAPTVASLLDLSAFDRAPGQSMAIEARQSSLRIRSRLETASQQAAAKLAATQEEAA